MDTIEIPGTDDPRHLRHVELDGFTLRTWDTGRSDRRGGTLTGYALFAPGEELAGGAPIFCGEDFGSSPLDAIDSDAALRSLLGFLTLRPGDTDPDYFAAYTDAQLAFTAEHAESLSFYAMDADDDPPPFRDLDGRDD